jgi:hypothetical protein
MWFQYFQELLHFYVFTQRLCCLCSIQGFCPLFPQGRELSLGQLFVCYRWSHRDLMGTLNWKFLFILSWWSSCWSQHVLSDARTWCMQPSRLWMLLLVAYWSYQCIGQILWVHLTACSRSIMTLKRMQNTMVPCGKYCQSCLSSGVALLNEIHMNLCDTGNTWSSCKDILSLNIIHLHAIYIQYNPHLRSSYGTSFFLP